MIASLHKDGKVTIVSALNMLFIGATGEFGAFESGTMAALLGSVPAVALGGIGRLVIVVICMAAFPALRRADRLMPVGPVH
jgi:hypothetical protein